MTPPCSLTLKNWLEFLSAQNKYELICDIPAKTMTIVIKTIPLHSISIKLIFDEQNPLVIKQTKAKEENDTKYQFEIDPPSGSQRLHFIQIESDLCKFIQSLSIN